MKSTRRKVLEYLLKNMASAVLKKYHPIIIGITGSVGKSSTKEAVALALGQKFSVRKNDENYNNEVGVPLTIIGAKSGKRSLVAWARVFIQWARLVIGSEKYPEVLVLELGIDRPKDMKYLLSFLPVQIGVMTNVSSSHLEFFKSVGEIAREKGRLISSLPSSGTAILCADDTRVMKLSRKTKAQVITFGADHNATISYEHFSLQESEGRFSGCVFKIVYKGKSVPIRLPYVIAEHHIMAILAGVSVGLALKLNLMDIATSLTNFNSLPGRMRVISGRKDAWIIDDTYNASPMSTQAALKTLASLPCKRRIAVLGDMLELGSESDDAHAHIADWIQEYNIDKVVLVGSRMMIASDNLEKKGFEKDKAAWFLNSDDAGDFVRDLVDRGDLVLIKGSQGMRMEKITEAIMMNPEDASLLLCRQSPDWKR